MDKKVFVLCGDQYKRNALQFINQLPVNPDKPLLITIQERTRTLDQNARLWATLGDIATQVVWHGQKLSSEDWKHIFTASLKGQRSAPGLEGGFVILGQSTSRMTVGELRDLIELINAFGATHGVKFSDESRLAIEWANRFGDKGKVAA
ncbi:recombination protein NinB [Yersinia enterocolitica]|uniref:NinB-like phage protein n=1 Tax=Yersinia enterocolitica TaxID=630 RepID=A0A0T9RU87_YEREN|nr:recombination protein NinB [Yersinia enterocolitica]UNA05528.1 recombination protein [Yersinia phage vB_YenM_29.18]UNA05602.1 recombination protein [Yersinia phage vB_YenM_06.16-1]UNA05675.1 recombination protein [Yersinia phage vB_YenM_21.09]UNA05806.1 recombination protein [Yersinia phage vB_YenM_210.17]EKN3690878.1 recombination protein NinB [Yersinia enterocolitica]